MAAAIDWDEFLDVPEDVGERRTPLRLVPAAEPCTPPTPVRVLHAPAGRESAAPIRLTRRGVVVLSAALALVAAAVIGLAWLSAPPIATAPARGPVADTVVVEAGDSLWSIAGRVAPTRDPREEVAVLQQLNQLDGAALVPGQVLRTH